MTQKKYQSSGSTDTVPELREMGPDKHVALIEQLQNCITALQLPGIQSVWSDYEDNTNYSKTAEQSKCDIVEEILSNHSKDNKLIVDLGANTGNFSQIAAKYSETVVSADFDEIAVDKNFHRLRENNNKNIIPLVLDLTNPTASIGWANQERQSFSERCNADVIISLALIHHLAIGNNVPLGDIARYFSQLGKSLIIEFVPKSDSQVKTMLATREDIFTDYSVSGFESAFQQYFSILENLRVTDSERTIYYMQSLA